MTPHIEAKLGEIAKTVIMPGDPNRAKFIADNYLENPKLVNKVRGNLAYTGTFKGKEVTVMSSGMGMPSMGIYATELFNVYNVDRIIRIGTCGGLSKDVKVESIILAKESYTTSNYAHSLTGVETHSVSSSTKLNNRILEVANDLNIDLNYSIVNTSDIFYTEYKDKIIEKMQCEAVEMETFALLFLAKHFDKDATAILTVSDNLVTKEELSSEDRETKLKNAILLALNSL